MHQTDTVERALQLARGSTCRSVDDIRRQLKAEGFTAVDAHLGTPSLKKQLGAVMKTLG